MNANRFGFIAALILSTTARSFSAESVRAAGADFEAPVPGSYTLPVIKRAADGHVIDAQNRPLALRDLTRGRVTVMSFIYTRCAAAKACPFATGVLRQLHRESQDDPALSAGLRLISLSFDPGGDTPQRMASYSSLARSDRPAADWHFVTTESQSHLQPILDGYGQAVDKRRNPRDPQGPLYHVLRVYLIDAGGNIRNIYSSATLDAQLVLADVKTLLMEKPVAANQ